MTIPNPTDPEPRDFLAMVAAVSVCGVACFVYHGVAGQDAERCRLCRTGDCTCRKAVRAVLAVLDSLRLLQPIATAPHDGTVIATGPLGREMKCRFSGGCWVRVLPSGKELWLHDDWQPTEWWPEG